MTTTEECLKQTTSFKKTNWFYMYSKKWAKKKIVNHLFCAVQSINNSKQNNCFRQSFHTDLENVTNTVNNLTNTATLTVE